jgi:hypothetical protein
VLKFFRTRDRKIVKYSAKIDRNFQMMREKYIRNFVLAAYEGVMAITTE